MINRMKKDYSKACEDEAICWRNYKAMVAVMNDNFTEEVLLLNIMETRLWLDKYLSAKNKTKEALHQLTLQRRMDELNK